MFLYSVRTDCGVYPDSYLIGTWSSFFGGKVACHENDHSPPSSPRSGMWSYIFAPPCVFLAWSLIDHKNKFTYKGIVYIENV
jgi:hypothetical protein